MRRLFLSVLVAGGLAFLAACSGYGGTGFSSGGNSNTTISRIAFSGSSGQFNAFNVAPIGPANPYNPAIGLYGPTTQINAVGSTANVFNVIVPDQGFTWAAAIAPGGTPWTTGTSGQTAACPATTQTPVVNSLYVYDTSRGALGGLIPYDGRVTSTVYVGPVTGSTLAAPYCINVVATHPGDGVQGSVVVRVGN